MRGLFLLMLTLGPVSVAVAAPVRVAVEQSATGAGTANDVVTQLNNDTYYDFTATRVTAAQIDTAAELAAYDVVILADSGYRDHDWTAAMATAIQAFVYAGGGMVGVGWVDFGVISTTAGGAELDDVLPIDAYPDSTNYFCNGTLRIDLTSTTHPVTSGLPSSISTTAANIEYNPLTLDSGATLLGTAAGSSCSGGGTSLNALAVDDYGGGRTVYIGLMYGAAPGYNPTDLRTGNGDRLLEQAVYWASFGSCSDADGDGHTPTSCGGTDCDDTLASVYPGATEVCNLVDDDCDGTPDDGLGSSWYRDADGDTYGTSTVTTTACTAPTGYVASATDCNDADAAIRPGATEVCNGKDDDCDSAIDEGIGSVWYRDADGDAYGTSATTSTGCTAPSGYVSGAGDCDDTAYGVNPGATEIAYDGIDQDCDGDDLVDVDEDGYEAEIVGGDDCVDEDADIYPGASETEDGVDADCDGTVDEGTDWYDDDGDGFAEAGGDCDDADAAVSPAAIEECNSVDDDCDGTRDEDTRCSDDDDDGFTEATGDCNDADDAVAPDATDIPDNGIDDDCDGIVDSGTNDDDGDGYSADAGDCADGNATRFPGAEELDNGIDDDCDGEVDEGTPSVDDDGDGFSEDDGDCWDGDDSVHPGADEPRNGIDDDCDGLLDEGSEGSDDDGDGWSEEAGDCDDDDPDVNPGADEVHDGSDQDCDGRVDEGVVDVDGDGISEGDGDCNDENGWVRPGQTELCDGVDNDCDGDADEDGACDDEPVVYEEKKCGCDGTGGLVGLFPVLLAALGARRRLHPDLAR